MRYGCQMQHFHEYIIMRVSLFVRTVNLSVQPSQLKVITIHQVFYKKHLRFSVVINKIDFTNLFEVMGGRKDFIKLKDVIKLKSDVEEGSLKT